VRGVNYVRQIETHIADLLVSVSSASDVEMDTEKLRRHKSPGASEIRSEVPNTEVHDQVRSTLASYSEGPRLQSRPA